MTHLSGDQASLPAGDEVDANVNRHNNDDQRKHVVHCYVRHRGLYSTWYSQAQGHHPDHAEKDSSAVELGSELVYHRRDDGHVPVDGYRSKIANRREDGHEGERLPRGAVRRIGG